ncbi:MAG: putative dsRNA-binding protein [Actinomycetota bacterium]|nr:putative dsRNA-binding protein [Actinomycetota bacterium]
MEKGIRAGRGGIEGRKRQPPGPAALMALIRDLPGEVREPALMHSSWVEHRADSYGRLAFLGDSVLGLAIAEHLFVRHPRSDIGHLTKVHGQAVSGRACATVAVELGLPELMAAVQPRVLDGGIDIPSLLASERAMASICESVIGACYLHHGFEETAPAVVAAFAEQVELASETVLDFKSALQERLARNGGRVRYEVTEEEGPPHERNFEVAASVEGEVIGTGNGRSKKAAEQAAAAEALNRLSE